MQISVQLLTPSFDQIVIYFYLALILGADDVRGSNGRESLPFTRKVVVLYFGNNTHKITMPLILFVFVWLGPTQHLFGWVTCFCRVLS